WEGERQASRPGDGDVEPRQDDEQALLAIEAERQSRVPMRAIDLAIAYRHRHLAVAREQSGIGLKREAHIPLRTAAPRRNVVTVDPKEPPVREADERRCER